MKFHYRNSSSENVFQTEKLICKSGPLECQNFGGALKIKNQMSQFSSNQEAPFFAFSDSIFKSRHQSIALNEAKISHHMSLGK